jgi:hypothetical protein
MKINGFGLSEKWLGKSDKLKTIYIDWISIYIEDITRRLEDMTFIFEW